jgi:opacity protein-like surface antigen
MRTLIWVAVFAAMPAFAASPFLRIGAGLDRAGDTTVRDRNCTATAPPALFGCGIDARGDFGRSATWTAGAGYERGAMRIELAITHRPDLRLDAQASFLGVSEDQPVDARVRSTSAMIVASRQFHWFFVDAGAGVARNTIARTRYSFPSIAPDAVTMTAGGTRHAFAWTVGAGITVPVSERLAFDFALTHARLGDVESEAGPATIVRPSRTFTLDIAGTRAKLETTGVTASLRWRR